MGKEEKQFEILIKIGGSITEQGTVAHIQKLGAVLKESFAKQPNFAIIPGGGLFSETVREAQKKFKFDDDTAHWMAILAMEQQAILLNYFIPESKLISYSQWFKENYKEKQEKKIPILKVWDFMRNESKLEHSWDTTSDAIAAEIAKEMKVKKLIFVKDVDGIIANREIKWKISAKEIIEMKESPLDKNTPKILQESKIKAIIVNGFYPERIRELLIGTNEVIHTEIVSQEQC